MNFPKSSIRNLLDEIAPDSYLSKEARDRILKQVEAYTYELTEKSVDAARLAKRRTIYEKDVELAIKYLVKS